MGISKPPSGHLWGVALEVIVLNDEIKDNFYFWFCVFQYYLNFKKPHHTVWIKWNSPSLTSHYCPTPFHYLRLADWPCLSCYSQHSPLFWNYPGQGLWDRSPGLCNFPGCSVSLEDLVLMTQSPDAAKIPDPDGREQPGHQASLPAETTLPQWDLGLKLCFNLGERIQENCSFEAAASHGGSGLKARASEVGRPGSCSATLSGPPLPHL